MKTLMQEIMEAIENGGEVRINAMTTLKRWTDAGGGSKVDELEVRFKIKGVKLEKRYKIENRDYQGIIWSIKHTMAEFLGEVTGKLASDLEAGYKG